jgi:hypothetical protein
MSTTWQTHARIHRKVINMDAGGTRKIVCAWDECDRDGYELFKITQHEHAQSIHCDNPLARHPQFVFCSEQHKAYFLNCMGPRQKAAGEEGKSLYGHLPAGMDPYYR